MKILFKQYDKLKETNGTNSTFEAIDTNVLREYLITNSIQFTILGGDKTEFQNSQGYFAIECEDLIFTDIRRFEYDKYINDNFKMLSDLYGSESFINLMSELNTNIKSHLNYITNKDVILEDIRYFTKKLKLTNKQLQSLYEGLNNLNFQSYKKYISFYEQEYFKNDVQSYDEWLEYIKENDNWCGLTIKII